MAEQLTTQDSTSWYQWVTNFDTAWNQFNVNYQALLSLSGYIYEKHPELIPEYDKLVNDGSVSYAKLVQLKELRDTVAGWLTTVSDYFKNLFGLSGTDNQMGALPFVIMGVASASAALAAITYWIADAYKFAQKINAVQDLESKGYTPAQVNSYLEKTKSEKGIFDNLENIVKWGIMGLGIILLLPRILEMGKRK